MQTKENNKTLSAVLLTILVIAVLLTAAGVLLVRHSGMATLYFVSPEGTTQQRVFKGSELPLPPGVVEPPELPLAGPTV